MHANLILFLVNLQIEESSLVIEQLTDDEIKLLSESSEEL